MATKNEEQVYVIPSFDAGQQSKTSLFLNQKTELRLAKNVDLQYIIGAASKSLGYVQKGNEIASSRTLLGASSLQTSGGTDKLIAFANKAGSGSDAYIYNSSTEAWDAASRSFSTDQLFETARLMDQLFVVNGITDAPENYNGASWSATTNVTDMPKARYIFPYEGRLFLFNINIAVGGSFPSRVWYSNLPINNVITWDFESGTNMATTASSAIVTSSGALFKTRGIKPGDPIFITTGSDAGEYTVLSVDSETQLTLTVELANTASSINFWVGGNWFDVKRDNSDVGKWLEENGGRLLCFKRLSLSRFLKTDDAATDSLEPVKGAPGTVAGRGVVSFKQYTFYPADSGIWRYDGANSQLISAPMQEVWDGVSASNYGSIVGWSVDDRLVKIYVGDVSNAATGLTIPKCVMVYDAQMESWWCESLDHAPKAQTYFIESNQLNHYMFSTGFAFKTENGNDFDGEAIDMEVETPFHFPIAPEVSVNITRIKVYTQDGRSVDCQHKLAYYLNNGEFTIDDQWRNPGCKNRSNHEQNYVLEESKNKASGIALKFREVAKTGRPAILRVAIFYTGGDIR